MKNYADSLVINTNNILSPAVGASVTVNIHNGGPAVIYSDDGITPTSNPVITDANGRYNFFVADGRYDLIFSGNNFTTFTNSNIEIADVTEATVSADSPWNIGDASANIFLLNNTVTCDGVKYTGASALQNALAALPAS